MLKTNIITQNNNLQLTIPDSYVGKELEVLVYAKEEINSGKIEKVNNAARFKGLFTEKEGEEFDQYLKQARSEWDGAI